MKKLFKNKQLYYILAAAVIIILAVMLYSVGFRITYAPELENSWDAISALAAWVGVIASFIAIWYAIQVPKKIADRQDKIALFEKRYESFQLFQRCFALYKVSIKEVPKEKIEFYCLQILQIKKFDDLDERYLIDKITQFELLIHQMTFLFPDIQEEDTSNLYISLYSYLSDVVFQNDIENSKQDYIKSMENFLVYTDRIWDSLQILNKK